MNAEHRIQMRPTLVAAIGVFVVLLTGVGVTEAQTPPASGSPSATTPGIHVVAPAPAHPIPDFGFESALAPEQGTPREDGHLERTRTIYQPAFVKGGVKTTRTSRTSGVRGGLSGWTGSRIPYDFRESSGFPAFGLTIQWGAPMAEEPAEPAPPAQR
jgi:hypothetical protein